MNASIRHDAAGKPVAEGMRDLPKILELIGLCRGSSLSCGMLAVLVTTAEDPEERETLVAEFLDLRRKFLDGIAEKRRLGAFLADIPEIAKPRAVVNAFDATLAAMPDTEVTLTRAGAVDLAARARREVIPAIREIMAYLGGLENEAAEAQLERVREKSAIIDGMLSEMRSIGKMIGLISINASVEAARAGGESGRSFQVIAQEVRTLARQSSDVLERMTSRISDTTSEKDMRIKRSFR